MKILLMIVAFTLAGKTYASDQIIIICTHDRANQITTVQMRWKDRSNGFVSGAGLNIVYYDKSYNESQKLEFFFNGPHLTDTLTTVFWTSYNNPNAFYCEATMD